MKLELAFGMVKSGFFCKQGVFPLCQGLWLAQILVCSDKNGGQV